MSQRSRPIPCLQRSRLPKPWVLAAVLLLALLVSMHTPRSGGATGGYGELGSGHPRLGRQSSPISWLLSRGLARWFPFSGRRPPQSRQSPALHTQARIPKRRESGRVQHRGHGSVGGQGDELRRVLVETNQKIGAFARSKKWREALSTFQTLSGRDGAPFPDVISYTNLITAYARCALWEKAVSILGSMRGKVKPDTIMCNAVIAACARRSEWVQACKVRDYMAEEKLAPNAGTYSSIINALTRGDQWEEALAAGDRAKQAKARLNQVVYTALINAASRGRQWQRALDELAEMQKASLRVDSIAYSSLVTSSVSLPQAQAVAARLDALMLRRDASAYNAVIAAHARGHAWSDAMAHFETMKRDGVRLNLFTYNTVIGVQTSDNNYEGAEWLFKEMQKSQLRADVIAYNLRINALARGGQRERAFAVVEEMNHALVRSNKYTYDFLITACEQAERFDEGEETFDTLRLSGVRMDVVSYTKHIKFCKERGDWRRALRTFADMLQASVRANDVSYKTLISVCSIIPEGAANAANAVFLEMRMSNIRADVTAHNTLISACANEHWTRALKAFRAMQEDQVEPDVVTYNALLSAFERNSELALCRKLLREMKVRRDAMTYAAYINCAGRAGKWEVAREAFEEMRESGLEADTGLYNTLITAFSRTARWQAALAMVAKMSKEDVPRDSRTFVAAMRACQVAGRHAQAVKLGRAAERAGTPLMDASVMELLIKSHEYLGDWEEALSVLDRVSSGSLGESHLYGLVLGVLARDPQHLSTCFALFESMREKAIGLGLEAYNNIMRAMADSGRWSEALELFDRMLKENVEPDSRTYDIVITLHQNQREVRIANEEEKPRNSTAAVTRRRAKSKR